MTTLLYSGNVGLGQDLESVLRAASQLREVETLRILIVGGGKGLFKYWELVSKLELTNVDFRPPVPLFQLPALMAEGDIHIVCQKPGTEGLLVPSKIYSTLAAGRPTLFVGPVDCEVGWILRDSDSGFVIAPSDIDGIKAALTKLLTSSELCRSMGKKARRYYESHFGRDKSVPHIVEILEKSSHSKNNGHTGLHKAGLQEVESVMECEDRLVHPSDSLLWRSHPKHLFITIGSIVVRTFTK